MKKTLLALLLCLCVALLAACQSSEPQRFDALGNQNNGNQQNNVSAQNLSQPANDGGINFDDGSYDPASEEGRGDEVPPSLIDVPQEPTYTAAPTVHSQYAGATPVLIDPIDKPTPTVVPPLTFTYQAYDATNLGLSFQGPVGWVSEMPDEHTFVIYNPDPAMDYAATLTVTAQAVDSDYSESALKSHIQSMLSTIRYSGFSKFDGSNTAPRTLIGKNGIYANYTGTLNGSEVAGRVHATCLDKVLYTVHITYPRAYTDTYKNGVYDKLRETIKVTK